MPRCEDFPCCGHEAGDCPALRADGSEIWKCVECGKRLPRNAPSSICAKCQRNMFERTEDDNYDPFDR